MEAFLAAGSAAILAVSQLAPALSEGLPATDLRFHLSLHGYGISLALLAIAVNWLLHKTRGKNGPRTPPAG